MPTNDPGNGSDPTEIINGNPDKALSSLSHSLSHSRFSRFPFVGAFFLYIGGTILCMFLGIVLDDFLRMVIPVYRDLGMRLGFVAAGLIVLGLYRWWFHPDFKGNLRLDGLPRGLAIAWPMYVYWLITFFMSVAAGVPANQRTVPLSAPFGVALSAGVMEEVTFRGLPGSFLMRAILTKQPSKEAKHLPKEAGQSQKSRDVLKAALFTSAVFGLAHVTNIPAGARVDITLLQMVGSFLIGVFLCAVYFRTGNLLVTMLIHFTHDIVAMACDPSIQNGVMTGRVGVLECANIGLCAMLALYGVFLLRREKCLEIMTLWKDRWSL